MWLRSHARTGRKAGEDGTLLSGKPAQYMAVVHKVRRVQGFAPRPFLGGLMSGTRVCVMTDVWLRAAAAMSEPRWPSRPSLV